jgi:transcriptional regulator with XRE-family HTH domain
LDRSPIVTRINALLAKKNISKAEFYEKCNLTSASYSNWNTGKTRPKMKNIEKIARFLGVTSEYLLYGDGAEKESAPDPKTEGEGLSAAKKALLVAIDDLSDAQCEKLLPIVLSAKQVL